MSMDILQPPNWPRPKGYANGIAASGRMVFVAGMVGWNEQGVFESDDLPTQVRQALLNAMAVLKVAAAGPQHVVRMTWYLKDRQDYLASQKEIGEVYRDVMGRHFPAMTVVEVSGLLEPQARVEIEVTAVIPQQ
jgi:enamine deaminase RidA (YjgF/YER057c/UK114 family)